MCNNQMPVNRFDSEKAYHTLSKKYHTLANFMVKLVSEIASPNRSSNFTNLVLESREITDGIPVDQGEHPECCRVGYRLRNGGTDWNCTGVLIHSRIVLTAAHCITNAASKVVALNTEDENRLQNAELIDVRKVIVHPQYSSSSGINDIAILILQIPAITPFVPIATHGEILSSSKVKLVGFGSNDSDGFNGLGVKRKGDANIISIRKTINEDLVQEESRFGYESDLEFVAGGNGPDTCNGDSGGPAYININGSLKVAGLTSRGTRDARRSCGDGGIYTRTDVHASFIKKNLSDFI